MLKKMLVHSVDWFLYKFLNTKQKQYISTLLTQQQKQVLKRIIKPGKQRTELKKIERAKYRLYNLGFTDKGLEELEEFYAQDKSIFLKRLAAWELALYYANQYSEDGAKKSLEYVSGAIKGVKDKELLRKVSILKAESYHILGKIEEAKHVISHALASKSHADLYLAAANLESSPSKKIKWINKLYEYYNITPILFDTRDNLSLYDRLHTRKDPFTSKDKNLSKVSVIIPAYNSESTIQTALQSLLQQTWSNLEILVVDDCSTDRTKQVVESYARKDRRVKLLTTKANSGAYVARNIALRVATGDFIT